MNENKEFKPYIPADKITPEFTVTSIIMGVILAVIFGAANAYLGLRVGMTVSASIPAAVISMGVIRKIMKKNSILESNMVQTIGSAGESLAAGAIFTMPALFLWAEEGLCEMPGIVEITLIALCGGVLGVLFMVPLRNALIVKEHATLLYPEGTACADVLLAGEEGGANAATVFSGMGIAAIFKFVVDGLKVIPADVAVAFKGFKGEIGMECYPALLGVGYIVGPRIASFMFVGSLIGWMVLIPVICLFGADTVMYPGTETISALYAAGGASKIWSTYVKYIGAGAIATGGIISLIKSLPLIIATFRDSMKSMKGGKNTSTERTAQDLPMNVILIGIVAMVAIIWLVPAIPVNPIGLRNQLADDFACRRANVDFVGVGREIPLQHIAALADIPAVQHVLHGIEFAEARAALAQGQELRAVRQHAVFDQLLGELLNRPAGNERDIAHNRVAVTSAFTLSRSLNAAKETPGSMGSKGSL